MRILVQRVSAASVEIDGMIVSEIEKGICVFLGITHLDTIKDADWLSSKLSTLRIFNDGNGKMNLSLGDVDGSVLLISQFTLYAKTKKGNRPSFIAAAQTDMALKLYHYFLDSLSKKLEKTVKSGVFGADMDVKFVNHGPLTIWIDSQNRE
jgi:D-aminoacyl-tRNA deacylase